MDDNARGASSQGSGKKTQIGTGAELEVETTDRVPRLSKPTVLGASGALSANEAASSTAPPEASSGGVQVRFNDNRSLIGKVLADRYRILSRLGEGGMGVVYLAEHIVLEKKLALKVLIPELSTNQTLVSRFMSEAKAATKIGHENIVDITDFGSTPTGGVFFAMELLDGEDISQLLESRGRIPWEEARDIAVQICRGLGAAHRKGIVHRDLKPDNVFVVDQGGRKDFVKILDFGIAKFTGTDTTDRKQTKTGVIFGTPDYMSPEQASGNRVDHRSDIYALGVILYEMVVGQVPFESESFMGVLSKHMFSDAQPPRQANPEANIPPSVESVIMKAMAKDQEERFQSMEAFAEALLSCSEDADEPAGDAVPRTQAAAPVSALADEISRAPTGALTPAVAAEEVEAAATPAVDDESSPREALAEERPPQQQTPAPKPRSAANVTAPSRGTGGGGTWIAVGIALLLGLGVGVYFLTRGGEEKPPAKMGPPAPRAPMAATTPTPDAAPVPKPDPPAAMPATPSEVSISIVTNPPGATVYLDGESLGVSTPVQDHKVSYGTTKQVIELRKKGYKTVQIEFVPRVGYRWEKLLEKGTGAVQWRPSPRPVAMVPPSNIPPMIIIAQPRPMQPRPKTPMELKDPFGNQ